jgi:hypothetical protein
VSPNCSIPHRSNSAQIGQVTRDAILILIDGVRRIELKVEFSQGGRIVVSGDHANLSPSDIAPRLLPPVVEIPSHTDSQVRSGPA